MATATQSPRLHRTIWYMGAKARVIPGFLGDVLSSELRTGDTVVDLMSGTGVVSAYCADRYRVYANDVQAYAATIAKSLIEHDADGKDAFLSLVDPAADLGEIYRENMELLEWYYGPALREEERLLGEFVDAGSRLPSGRRGAAWLREYRAFVSNAAAVHPPGEDTSKRRVFRRPAKLLTEASLERYREDPRRRPCILVTAYWANVYFGLRQALQIDSIRAAIDALLPEQAFSARRRTHYLSALIHAASVGTSGTSHFAQPRGVHKDSELVAMARRRTLDMFELTEEYSREIARTVERTRFRAGNRAFVQDYRDLLGEPSGRTSSDGRTSAAGRAGPAGRTSPRGRRRKPRGPRFEFPSKAKLVYLDPPYTADNYSRFYHVLEVLARYDYPPLQKDRAGAVLRGRYPEITRRFRSGFCSARAVEGEFRRVAQATAASGAKLVISYSSPTGLLLKEFRRREPSVDPLEAMRRMCRDSFRRVEILTRPFMHSGQGDSNIDVDELLVVCTQPK